MASTRNKNTKNDYCLEQRENRQFENYTTYNLKRTAYDTRHPCFGVNVGYRPNNVMAYNATDIESSLYGINSSNLVNPQPEVKPELKTHKSVSFFDRPQVYVPEPLIIEDCQRPDIFRR